VSVVIGFLNLLSFLRRKIHLRLHMKLSFFDFTVDVLFDLLVSLNQLDALDFSVSFGLAQLLHAELDDLVFGSVFGSHVGLILRCEVIDRAFASLEQVLEL